jgi:oxygen-independent coproporphyrinogen-3 oxidase
MPGLYLHIPFCKKACHYCNFHFSTSLRLKEPLLDALLRELELRKDFFQEDKTPLQSIYFGGGTPSLLTAEEIERILEAIYRYFAVDANAEITLEANPDDLHAEFLRGLRLTPINRLSIGVQSFADKDLQWMNRAHAAEQSRSAIEHALAAGFDNLTCDLIYGAPVTSDEQWAENIQILLDYGIPHISCYCLTVEPKTALDHLVKTGKSPAVEEEKATRQFLYLMDALEAAGFEHYEISNFARPGHYARHNTAYWTGAKYLGLGPGAHSFDGVCRQWNLPNNARYVKEISAATDWASLEGMVFDREVLTPRDRYNEYVMTGLRTQWGCSKAQLSAFGASFFDYFREAVIPFLEQSLVLETEQGYCISKSGKLLADFIAAELFFPAGTT